ncbi:MAG: DUF1570 domain-containing protein [Planctomycetota bacterium]
MTVKTTFSLLIISLLFIIISIFPLITANQSDSPRTKEPAREPFGLPKIKSTGSGMGYIFGEVQQLSGEEKLWSEQKTKVAPKISEYQYADAIASLTTFLKFITNENLKQDINYWLADLKDEMTLFNNMAKGLSTQGKRQKIVLSNKDIWIIKADENGFEGSFAGLSGSVYKRQWKDIPSKTIYDLFPNNLSKWDYFYLALFCYSHNLIRESERILIICLKQYPEQQERISRSIARYRNVPLPPGGFCEYEKKIITVEEKSYLEKGYVKYEGEWMPYEDMMTAKGFVNYQDKWITVDEKAKQEFNESNLEALKKLLAPKGVIDQPGADKENLPWDKARTKETDHYVITANLTQEALDDLCFLMECFFFEASRIFKFYNAPDYKLKVYVFKNNDEYDKNGGIFGSGGVFMGDRIMTFYQPSHTTSVLLHEGTHQFVHMVCSSKVPLWIHEGLASYYESSKFEGTSLKTNIVNRERLKKMQERISQKTASTFDDIINLDVGFSGYEYAHSWSLIYFFMNYKNGHYANSFDKYFQGIKKEGIHSIAQHNELFEKTFNEKIDVIERQWEDYILNLK